MPIIPPSNPSDPLPPDPLPPERIRVGERAPADAPKVAADWRTMHLWHIQPVRDILVILVLIGIIYLGYVLRTVTVPMLLALMLAYLFEPLVKRLTRINRVSRPLAVSGILATFVLLIVLPLTIGLGFAIVQTASLAGNIARNTGALVTSIRSEKDADRRSAYRKLPSSWRWMSDKMTDMRVEVQAYREHQRQFEGDNGALPPDATDKPKDGTPATPPTDPPANPDPGASPAPTPPAGEDAAPQTPPTDDKPKAADGDPDASPGASPGTEPGTDPGPDPKSSPTAEVSKPTREVSEWKMNLYEMVDRGIDWVRANAEGIAKTAGQRALSGGAEAAIIAVGALMSIVSIGITAFLTGFFFFFFSVSWGGVLRFWAEFIPRAKRSKTFDLVEKMDAVIAGFVRGRLTICAILGVLMTILYWFIGVPMPLVLGAVVGLLFIVPFIHIIGVPIAILLLWLDPSRGPLATLVGGVTGFAGNEQATWWWILFAPLAVYLLAQFLDDWVLSPMIAGKATNMDTPTILFASLAGGVLAGLYGVLLAIPVAACIKILIQDVVWPRFKAWAAGKSPDFLPLETAAEKAGEKKPPSS